jgi:hypothetical protein
VHAGLTVQTDGGAEDEQLADEALPDEDQDTF